MSMIIKCEENPFDDDEKGYATCVPCNEPSSTNPERSVVRCLWCRKAIIDASKHVPFTLGFFEQQGA